MSAVPADVDTETQPPMSVPLGHFLVALGLLVAGAAVGAADRLALLGGAGWLAQVHLLLAGWVCVTIMGAMTQFVPVWSGVRLHSRRLARAQLWLVAAGVAGFAGALAVGAYAAAPAFAAAMLAGFWLFAYNVGRTLAAARPLDVTEGHFALALAWFVALTVLGLLLAVGFVTPVVPVQRGDLRAAHATVAVFGAVLTTVAGALAQLVPMFTQTDARRIDRRLQRFESVALPLGVLALAGGRLLGTAALARVGGLLVVAALVAVAVVLARRLRAARVAWTPMLARYAVVAASVGAWAVLAGPTLVARPLAPDALFGGPAGRPLLLFGVVGFVVVGTLYHVVPFIVWVHRYSDRLGYEPVPSVDDLYDAPLARADLLATLAGLVGFVAADLASGAGRGGLAEGLALGGGAAAALGALAFAANMVLVVRRHGPRTVPATLLAATTGHRRTPDGERSE